MSDINLKKLSRADLLEMMIAYSEEAEAAKKHEQEYKEALEKEKQQLQHDFAEERARMLKDFEEEKAMMRAKFGEQKAQMQEKFDKDVAGLKNRLSREKAELQQQVDDATQNSDTIDIFFARSDFFHILCFQKVRQRYKKKSIYARNICKYQKLCVTLYPQMTKQDK